MLSKIIVLLKNTNNLTNKLPNYCEENKKKGKNTIIKKEFIIEELI